MKSLHTRWNHIVSFRKSVLCSYYISILQNRNSINKKTKTRSKRTNSAENIWSFHILIDLILWQILVRSEKLEFAFFASMYARKSLFAFDALFFLSISRSSSVCFTYSTYFMNFLQSNSIEIESLMSQKISENSEIHNDATWCDQHSRSSSQNSNNWYLFHDVSTSQF